MPDSKQVVPEKWLQQIKIRYEELSHKGWHWSSFYNGALEGFYLAYLLGIIIDPEEEKRNIKEQLEYEYKHGYTDGLKEGKIEEPDNGKE